MQLSSALRVLFVAAALTPTIAWAATTNNGADGAAKGQATELTTTIADANGASQCVAQGGKVLTQSSGQKTCSINYNASKSNTLGN